MQMNKMALFVIVAAILAACDQSPKNTTSSTSSSTVAPEVATNRSTPTSHQEEVSTVNGTPPQAITLNEITDSGAVSEAQANVVSASYTCSTASYVWSVAGTASSIPIFKIECPEGTYQMSVIDSRSYIKPWTGVMLGN
jgi:hypothetical protein